MDECEGFYLIWEILRDFSLKRKSLLEWQQVIHRARAASLPYLSYKFSHSISVLIKVIVCNCELQS